MVQQCSARSLGVVLDDQLDLRANLQPFSSSTFQSFPTSRPCYGQSTDYQLLLGSVLKFWLWPTLQPTRRPLPTYRKSFRITQQLDHSAATGRLAHPANRATVSRLSRLRSPPSECILRHEEPLKIKFGKQWSRSAQEMHWPLTWGPERKHWNGCMVYIWHGLRTMGANWHCHPLDSCGITPREQD